MAPYEELQETVIAGDADKVKEVIGALLEKSDKPLEIISEGLIPGMSVVGQKMKDGEMYIPEVMASAHAMGQGMELLKPLITVDELSTIYKGKVVIGTGQGDLHNIGKKIVTMLIDSGGYTVVDLGVDVSADKFVEAVKQEKSDILGLSALLTTTMPRMAEAIEALKRNNLRDGVKIIVGGAPVSQKFADTIGADGYAPDAVCALDKVKQLMG